MSDNKPVIFISYSHKDRRPMEFVQGHLEVAVTNDHFETWDDRRIQGGADWEKEIDAALSKCAAFILLVSRHSLVSSFILKKEVQVALEAHWKRGVHIYPIVIGPCDLGAVPWLTKMNLRPRDAKALSLYTAARRDEVMATLAAEIRGIVNDAKVAKPASARTTLEIGRLPETGYKRLVGREAELQYLDAAWESDKIDIVSLVAEGGAGKSALVNEWLKRLQGDGYRGAEAVLGWSFFSQGTDRRATSADEFLNWALDKLDLKLETNSAITKGDAIADELASRNILLLLDGVEPLQHGPDGQLGQLKDQGLRALLRRFAATPPSDTHGLIVLTSRLTVEDISRWSDIAAPIKNVEHLSDEAGAALLRDNGVSGSDKDLVAATRDFGGHPLALALLASFLKETQKGDVRKRDVVRNYLADKENSRHDHARRVMESYEKEWLSGQPVLLAIMHIAGLFDRPASADCLKALRAEPGIDGLTDQIVKLDEAEWQRGIFRLRDVRLIAPLDPAAPDALDAHPLVREWFGERFRQINSKAWKTAHGRLYEHLRDHTKEGGWPSLEQLTPLYQAIAHGCRADRHQEVLDDVYANRLCKLDSSGNFIAYSAKMLGALGSDLAAVSWFFDKPYEIPVGTLRESDRSWILNEATYRLRGVGRLAEALPTMRAVLQMVEEAKDWPNASVGASNLSDCTQLAGNVSDAVKTARASVAYADHCGNEFYMVVFRATLADKLNGAGDFGEAKHVFEDAERRQSKRQPEFPLLYSLGGYRYCDLLLSGGDFSAVCDRAAKILDWELQSDSLLDRSLVRLALGRAHFGLASTGSDAAAREAAQIAVVRLVEAVDGLRASGQSDDLPRGLLARAAFRRCVGDGGGATRDLDEVEEIAGPGPMKLFLCDLALERARLAFATCEAFAPLNGMVDNLRPKPMMPSAETRGALHDEAAKQLKIAAEYIATCGYRRRDAELAELQEVLRGEKEFADLPPRV